MLQVTSAEIDSTQIVQQLAADLAQARTVEAGVAGLATAFERALAPQGWWVIWEFGGVRRMLGGQAGGEPPAPDAGQLAELQAGRLVTLAEDERLTLCYAPLRARGALLGWLALSEPTWAPEHAGLLATIAALAGPALAGIEGTSRQDERGTQLRTLNEIGQLLAGALDSEQIMAAIHAATCRVVDASTFYIALYDQATDEFELAYLAHDGDQPPIGERWSGATGLAGVVAREHQPLRVDDYLGECKRRGLQPHMLIAAPSIRSWLGVPLLARDRLIGVLVVSSARPGYSYRPEHTDLLMTIATHAAVAIERARLYQQSERQARQLLVLNRIGRTITSSIDPQQVPSVIMRQVTELLDVEEGSLLLADDDSGDMVFAYTTGPIGERLLGQRLPRGTGLVGYVVSTGQSVVVNDAQRDNRFDRSTDRSTGFTTRTLLAVPLRAVGGVQGAIEVLNRRDGSPFTQEDQRLLEAVADYAVIALENARRFAQIDQALARRAQELARTNDLLQQNLRSLTALNAFGMAINTTLRSPDEILGMTARGVVEMSGALGAAVFLPDGDDFRNVVSVGPAVPAAPHLTPLLQRVMMTGRPETLITDLAPLAAIGARALLVVPLRATQRTLGGLCVFYADSIPEPPDRETVVLFATQAAAAVESIELFSAVRAARDQMASILASTREGIMLIGPDARVAIANAALHQLCSLATASTRGVTVDQFLRRWEEVVSYAPEERAALRRGLEAALAGRESFAAGELNGQPGRAPFLEWSLLTAHGSGDSRGGVLLVLRDITEAKESERLRQDLTHMIVHDLRSPLASVMAAIELLTRGVSGQLNEKQRNILNIANNSAAQMLEMINVLLDISRLEAGRMPIELKTTELRPLISNAAQQLASLAQERGITIRNQLGDTPTLVRADSGLVVRVVQNLIGNAIKFSGRGSTITVSAEPPGSDGFVRVAVADQGVGIAASDRNTIFVKFGQVGERRGGTGLGLTFCKLVVEAHNGQIWFDSEPGKGSTFFFTLPAVTA